MVDSTRLIGPDGGAVVLIRPRGRWPWLVALLGAVIVAIGGILVTHDQNPQPPATTQVVR